ncbi:hypothetical protein FA95DRAFT_1575888 [Auriscalpium vulgare]|uniref:Uncharacterized protein n=1 Tax=Auriscalpium vulgare TaxID=40419 RepID=A0ACB8RDH8_9AGAM|nr:hypothetical protein FA95DRAFT_1575888 [Auriscalpium vulgare]
MDSETSRTPTPTPAVPRIARRSTPKNPIAHKGTSKEHAATQPAFHDSKKDARSRRGAMPAESSNSELEASRTPGHAPLVLRTAVNEKPEPVPVDKWPSSKVPESSTITATDSYQKYRIEPQDLQTLCYEAQYSRNYRPGDSPMHLYREVEVERLAWKEHGGPAGWKQFLDEEYKIYTDSEEYALWCKNSQTMKRPTFHCPDMYCP